MLNPDQYSALELLQTSENVFLTGVAGSGKSYLVREFLRKKDDKSFPVLASTGAAAILVGGRTFHSFFGLGIMQGGYDATVERAIKNKKLVKRLEKAKGIVIDEISMLSGDTLRAAEEIARGARDADLPWGGLQVIAVGDFAQLPPVTPHGQARDWAFSNPVWARSYFIPAVLKTIVRTQEPEFLEILNDVREGRATPRVVQFLNDRKISVAEDFEVTRLFPRRDTVERYNLERLEKIPGKTQSFLTQYLGSEKSIEDVKRLAPIPEILQIKENALVMIRQNDPLGRWVNGSMGQIKEIKERVLVIQLLGDIASGRTIELEQANFTLLDAEGQEIASARNFPINLAYATTIHKAQGMTLDRAMVDLRSLWEPGQAYVAMSRVKRAQDLFVTSWTPSSILMDTSVKMFYRSLEMRSPHDIPAAPPRAWVQQKLEM